MERGKCTERIEKERQTTEEEYEERRWRRKEEADRKKRREKEAEQKAEAERLEAIREEISKWISEKLGTVQGWVQAGIDIVRAWAPPAGRAIWKAVEFICSPLFDPGYLFWYAIGAQQYLATGAVIIIFYALTMNLAWIIYMFDKTVSTLGPDWSSGVVGIHSSHTDGNVDDLPPEDQGLESRGTGGGPTGGQSARGEWNKSAWTLWGISFAWIQPRSSFGSHSSSACPDPDAQGRTNGFQPTGKSQWAIPVLQEKEPSQETTKAVLGRGL